MHTPRKLSVLIGILVLVPSALAAGEAHLMRHADIHGGQVVFTYEGDLWLAPSAGGDAHRITSHPGTERYAKFSPDGTLIAFTGSYDGGSDVYVMDSRGGVPARLTFHPSADRVLGWSPDGSAVLFRSRRQVPYRADRVYTVPVKGGMPEAVAVDRAGLATFSPDGTRLAYNRITREDRTWKRHQGGTAQDIWMGSLAEGDFRRITDWAGTDNFPMWEGEAIYFTSDRAGGTLNLFRYALPGGEVTALTTYTDYDVKYPSIGPGAIVYQYGEELHRLDLASGETRKIEITLASDRVPTRTAYEGVTGHTGAFRLSPEGDRLFLEARGEILSIPVEEGEPRNLTRSSGSREKSVAVSPDGARIVFLSDRTGEEELYSMPAGGGEWTRLTTDGAGFRLQPVVSPDGRLVVFADKSMRLHLVHLDSGKASLIDRSEYDDAWERWGIQDYVFSPDSRWIAYTKNERSQNESIFLYSVESGETTRLTDETAADWSPSFSPGGEYLYFLSKRSLSPIMGAIDQTHVFLDTVRPYLVLLHEGELSPFVPAAGKEEGGEEKGEKEVRDEDTPPVVIDLEDIARRILPVEGVKPGNYFRLEATEEGFLFLARQETVFLKYQNVTDRTTDELELLAYDLAEKKAEVVLEDVANYHLSADGKKLVYRAGGEFGVVDAGKKAEAGDGGVDLASVKIKVNRLEEFAQIFDEAWRVQRDWFYDAGMHGVDWEAVGEKYRRFVPFCGNRGDLNYLIGEMIGELNAGHTYVFGGDAGGGGERVPVGLLGADFETPGGAAHHRIRHIVPGNNWHPDERSPLREPGCAIAEGEYLISIDGQEVGAEENVLAFLEDKVGKRVTLVTSGEDYGAETTSCDVTPIASERAIRYREWVERNRARVEAASGGRIGYLHIPDMMTSGLIEFARGFYHHYYKTAFIIDDRYNSGGFVGDQIIDRLERRAWAMTQPREGLPQPNPERVFHGHLALLINEDTGSNGEFFAEAIKRKELATLIGKRTWGGAIGIEPHQDLVDGGVTTPPQFGLYGLDRTWLIEGHGVVPDIEVENPPSEVLAGRDPQLEAAIELLLERLDREDMELPGPPDYPDKSK